MKGASSQPQLLLGSGPCPLDWVMVRKRLLKVSRNQMASGFLAESSLSGAQHGSEDLLHDPHSVFIQEFSLLGALLPGLAPPGTAQIWRCTQLPQELPASCLQACLFPRARKTVSLARLLLPSQLGQSETMTVARNCFSRGFWKPRAGHPRKQPVHRAVAPS